MARTAMIATFLLVLGCTEDSPPPAGEADAGARSADAGGEERLDDAGRLDASGSGADAGDGVDGAAGDAGQAPPLRILVFTKTEGFRHGSIADGVAALEDLAEAEGWALVHTEDAGTFTDEGLADLDVTVWLNTTGDVLNGDQQAAFERFVQGGGGYVGVHSASDTEYDWPWYGELVGTWFDGHPRVQGATVRVEDDTHPATSHLGATWERRDEWYDFRDNPRGDVSVLLTVDESTYEGGSMGDDHPIAWRHEFDGGRAFYTGMGHTSETYAEPDFIAHLEGGIRWAAGP